MARHRYFLVAVAFLCFCAYSVIRMPAGPAVKIQHTERAATTSLGQVPSAAETDAQHVLAQDSSPNSVPVLGQHPIELLTGNAKAEFEQVKQRQSRTLDEAVQEYRRRYGIPPPPHFDKWFEFAKSNEVQMIDEYDTIHETLTPFWGLRPKTIRSRAKEALGFDNAMIGVAIRNHDIGHASGGKEWQRNSTTAMMSKFLQYLPDMDLVFNAHDEPRVMLPHEDLSRLVRKAQTSSFPELRAVQKPVNSFSKSPAELGQESKFEETKLTRFNTILQQAAWTHSRISCSPDSPARVVEDDEAVDAVGQYATGQLGFVSNLTAMSDICLTPSLASKYGFFDRPNTYSVSHDLFPIFSQSKLSSYADIIYPSPWYWSEKVPYTETKDRPWAEKDQKLFWRGSTTGGFSRHGGWRRQHRQNIIQTLNAVDKASIMSNKGSPDGWVVEEVPRGDYRGFIDVHFSHVGQCDGGDCEAQKQFFKIAPAVEQQDAWAYRHLLDMDGNAFSGRFYAFLKSRSLTFKYAIFREWHAEWIKPWAHYVPLSLRGDDWLETVRYFTDGQKGDSEAEAIATTSREWASKALRQVDMEAWFFRLLLEYARVIDDARENIGFDPASAGKRMADDGAI